MKPIVPIALSMLALVGTGQQPASMTDQNIQAAISHGLGKQELKAIKVAKRASLIRSAIAADVGSAYTPYLRVAFAARGARDIYKPFTVADVSPLMTEPLVYLYVPPQPGAGTNADDQEVGAESVFVMPKGSKDPASIIQPTKAEETTIPMQNLLGATWTSHSVTAAFPLSVLDGNHEFVVIYKGKPPQGGGPSGREIRGEIIDKNWK